MLSANPHSRKQYEVKVGYVYSDGRGNNYYPGQVVELESKQYDMARHRVKPYESPVLDVKPKVEEKEPKKESIPLGIFDSGNKKRYEVK